MSDLQKYTEKLEKLENQEKSLKKLVDIHLRGCFIL